MLELSLSDATQEQIQEELASRGIAVAFFSVDDTALPVVEDNERTAQLDPSSQHSLATALLDMTMREGIQAAADKAVAVYLENFLDSNVGLVANAADVALSRGPSR